MSKVYVALKFKLFAEEQFVGVAATQKGALEILKEKFPYMRGTIDKNDLSSDKNNTFLLQVREEELH